MNEETQLEDSALSDQLAEAIESDPDVAEHFERGMRRLLLESVDTQELLAELDRRAREARPPSVLFFGVWPGERAGHFVYESDGRKYTKTIRVIEGLLSDRTECSAMYPWKYWDGPTRGRVEVSAPRALELAREAFPKVFARIEAHLGKPVELAGPADEETADLSRLDKARTAF